MSERLAAYQTIREDVAVVLQLAGQLVITPAAGREGYEQALRQVLDIIDAEAHAERQRIDTSPNRGAL